MSLELQREQLRLQSLIHAQQIELGLKQIQADYDKERWAGILSRDETVNILKDSQQQHHLLMLLSEPEISADCPDTFKHNLPIAVRNELKQFMQTHYPPNHDLRPVQFFGKFFENKVFDTHVKQYEHLLQSVPTVVLYSQMTDENVYLHLHGWGFAAPLSETCVFNWEKVQNKLIAEGLSEKEAYKMVRKIIVALHQVFAAFFTDFYYLTVVNPLHESCLLTATIDTELQSLIEPFRQILQTLQQQNRSRYEMQLLTRQQEERQQEFLLQQERECLEESRMAEEQERERLEQERIAKKEDLEATLATIGIIGTSVVWLPAMGAIEATKWAWGKFKKNKWHIYENGTALDTETGLMWCRFAYGQQWENNTAVGKAIGMTWNESLEIPNTFNRNGGFVGFTDWRLPTIEELKTLIDIDKGTTGNYINADVFPNNAPRFWSSSRHSNVNYSVWLVYFDDGSGSYGGISNSYFVRLMRSEQ